MLYLDIHKDEEKMNTVTFQKDAGVTEYFMKRIMKATKR